MDIFFRLNTGETHTEKKREKQNKKEKREAMH